MAIPKKLIEFFSENKDKPKDQVIKEMMEKFKYKESSAMLHYSNRNENIADKKELVFNFLEENPDAIYDIFNKDYANKLGISKRIYAAYKSEYTILNSICAKKEMPEFDKHYKGRLRQKFIFDDSKLFL